MTCARGFFGFGFFHFFESFGSRIVQRFDPESHRLKQDGATAQDRQLENRILVAPLGKRRRLVDDGPVRLAYRDRVRAGGAHHDAFDNGLAADNQISFRCAHNDLRKH